MKVEIIPVIDPVVSKMFLAPISDQMHLIQELLVTLQTHHGKVFLDALVIVATTVIPIFARESSILFSH
jgi:hypothetical protein